MPNKLDANGLQVQTRNELITFLEGKMRGIYGNDINLEQNSPDGQMLQIYAQTVIDVLELVQQVYASFDPDEAVGKVLDQRVAYNGVQRQGGTFSRTPINVTTTDALTLYGLDQSAEQVFTVSDDDGNEWQLLQTQTPGSAGTYTYDFQAAQPGEVLTTQNTITTVVTIVLGVDSVNNPSSQSVIGVNEESDKELKTRRKKSVALSSKSYLDSLKAALANIEGISYSTAYENYTDTVDSDGIPAHGIWAIVEGNYTDEDVATAIYRNRNGGANMKGDESYTLTTEDGSPFTVFWDVVDVVEVFARFTVEGILNELEISDYEELIEEIADQYTPEVNENVNQNTLASIINGINDNILAYDFGFSETLGGSYTNILNPSAKDKRLSITEGKVIVLPIKINPEDKEVSSSDQIQFQAAGGYDTYTWSIETNNSGATINVGGTSGLYEAGGSSGTDTIRCTDQDGNFTETTVVVS